MTLPNRKAEAEVKSMQSALDALQRSKKEVESATTRKEKEIQALTDKLNCEQTNLSKSNKQVKECGVRMHLQSRQIYNLDRKNVILHFKDSYRNGRNTPH